MALMIYGDKLLVIRFSLRMGGQNCRRIKLDRVTGQMTYFLSFHARICKESGLCYQNQKCEIMVREMENWYLPDFCIVPISEKYCSDTVDIVPIIEYNMNT